MLKKVLFGGVSGLSFAANFGLTMLRVFAGASLMLAHGRGKIPPPEQFVAGTASIGFPMPIVFAWAAGLSEFLGGAFLALGLFTRVAGLFISTVMIVALLGVHFADPYQKQELAFLYLFIAAAFVFKGSGDWSMDRFLR